MSQVYIPVLSQTQILMQKRLESFHKDPDKSMDKIRLLEDLHRIRLLEKPTQYNRIIIGHSMLIDIPGNDEIKELRKKYGKDFSPRLHLLSDFDLKYLKTIMDGEKEFIASYTSPIGKALLGLRRGEQGIYNNRFKVIVIDQEDSIQTSSLFDLALSDQ